MTYFLWSLPILVIIVAIASGRVGAISAGFSGMLVALAVACTAAPAPLTFTDLLMSGGKGLWLSWLVAAVILAGLFFRDNIAKPVLDAHPPVSVDSAMTRRRVFAICFLIGPFAEAATGFGVGQVATVAALSAVGLAPLDVVLLGLFSQILVPWGAMANGTIIGAHLAGLPPSELGVASAMVSGPLLFAWLFVFWRMAGAAGLANTNAIRAHEVAWLLFVLSSLVCANRFLGPEIAGMATLGPLIVLRFWRVERPNRKLWRSAVRVGLPYAVLILGLAASRAVSVFSVALAAPLTLQPFPDGPVWVPLLHPGTWLAGVGILTAVISGRGRAIPAAAYNAWAHGRKAVLTIAIYLVVAQIMADSSMAQGIADGVRRALGSLAVIVTPLLAGALGFLTGSSNATNGLLMRSQVSLADGHVALVWIAALQNTAAAAMTMLSPVRVSMGCALVGQSDLQRTVYTQAWPLGAAALGVFASVAAFLLSLSWL